MVLYIQLNSGVFFGTVVCGQEMWCINTWSAQILICSSWLMHDWSLWSSQHRPHLSRWIKLTPIWVRCNHNKDIWNDLTGLNCERGFVQLHLNKNVPFYILYLLALIAKELCYIQHFSSVSFWSGVSQDQYSCLELFMARVCVCVHVHVCLCDLTISVSTGGDDIV